MPSIIGDLSYEVAPVDVINAGIFFVELKNGVNITKNQYKLDLSTEQKDLWIAFNAATPYLLNISKKLYDRYRDFYGTRDLKDFTVTLLKNKTEVVYTTGLVSGTDLTYRNPNPTGTTVAGRYLIKIPFNQVKNFGQGQFCVTITSTYNLRKELAPSYPIVSVNSMNKVLSNLASNTLCLDIVGNPQPQSVNTITAPNSSTSGPPTSSNPVSVPPPGTTFANPATNIWRYMDITGKQLKALLGYPQLPNDASSKTIKLCDLPNGSQLLNSQIQVLNHAGLNPGTKPLNTLQLRLDYSKDSYFQNLNNVTQPINEKYIQLTPLSPIYKTELQTPGPSIGKYNGNPIFGIGSSGNNLPMQLLYTLQRDGSGNVVTALPDDFRVRILFNLIIPKEEQICGQSALSAPPLININNPLNSVIPKQSAPSFKWYSKQLTGLQFKALTALTGSNGSTAKSSIIQELGKDEYFVNATCYVVKQDSSSFKPVGKLQTAFNGTGITNLGTDTFKATTGSTDTIFSAYSNLSGRDLPVTSIDISTGTETRHNQLVLNITQDTGGSGNISSISDTMELLIFYAVSNPESPVGV